MASLSETLRDWALDEVYSRLDRILVSQVATGGMTMAAIDDLNAAISGQYDVLLPAVASVDSELRRVRDLLANGASSAQLAEALANVNASTNRIKDAVSAVVADTSTPDPAPELPEVPAEPLPEEPVEVPSNGEDEDVPGDGLGAV